MNSTTEINYIGDDEYLCLPRVEEIVLNVIGNNWRLSRVPPASFKIDINIVSDKEIKEVNKKYLNSDRPTDVIAFSLEEGEKMPGEKVPLIGQILISREAAYRQAAEYGHSVKDEMTILLIHGLLHVAGWPEGEEIQKCQEIIRKKIQDPT